MIDIQTPEEVRTALGSKRALLFKHSTRCPVSAQARAVMTGWLKQRTPDVDVYYIDVIRNRAESDLVAHETGIRHESPQVILIRDQKPMWSATHWHITNEALDEALKA